MTNWVWKKDIFVPWFKTKFLKKKKNQCKAYTFKIFFFHYASLDGYSLGQNSHIV